MNFTSCAWLWLYAGAFLMLMELLAPGFVIFFFGLSAATVGLFRAVIGEAFSPTWQMVAFSVFSILYLVVLRRWLKKTFSGSVESASTDFSNEYVGRVGKVTEAISPPPCTVTLSVPGRRVTGSPTKAAGRGAKAR